MTMPDLPWDGGCRCGAVRIRITRAPILTGACHCTGCQRMTGSAFSLSVAIPADGFEVIVGVPVIGGLHGDEAQHYHCPACMSWMFTRAGDMDVMVRAPVLDEVRWFVPYMETCTLEKLPWATTPARRRFERFPDAEDYPGLMSDFAQTAL